MFHSFITFVKSPKMSLIIVLISAIFFSVGGIFAKKAADKGVPSVELTLFRASGQGIILIFPLAWILKVPLLPPKPARCRVACRGIIGSIAIQFYYRAVQCLPLGDAITLFSIYPAFTVFLSIPLLGEQLKIEKLIAILLSILGAVCIAQPQFLFENSGWRKPTVSTAGCLEWGYVAAFSGSFFGACVVISIRMVGKDAHTIHLLFSFCVFTCIVSIILWFINEDWVYPQKEERLDILLIVLFGSTGHFLFNYAGRLCHAGSCSIMRSTDVVWAYLWQITIFNVRPDILAIVGAVLVFVSGLTISLSKDAKQDSSMQDEGKSETGYFPLAEGVEVTNSSVLEG